MKVIIKSHGDYKTQAFSIVRYNFAPGRMISNSFKKFGKQIFKYFIFLVILKEVERYGILSFDRLSFLSWQTCLFDTMITWFYDSLLIASI